MELFKYSGAGNDFVVIDGRGYSDAELAQFRSKEYISGICDRRSGFQAADGRVGADGFLILSDSKNYDFRMEYFNSDGSGGMMCGNGGRCIVAFAALRGIRPSCREYVYEAPDGVHSATLLSGGTNGGGVPSGGATGDAAGTGADGVVGVDTGAKSCEVRLGLRDAFDLRETLGGWFLNTGTRHFVKFVPDVEAIDIMKEGAELRWNPDFAPEGSNVNFVQFMPDGSLKIRTYEKGVEAETLACGTGITASAIAAHFVLNASNCPNNSEVVSFKVHARIADLTVEFRPCRHDGICAESIFLTGPVERI